MEKIPWTSIAGILFLCLSIADGYSKYGRSCNDIGCRSNEECVMAEDPCTYHRPSTECGKYPKCLVKSGGGASCRTMQCPLGKYCKTVDGQPTCADTSSQLAPAARRPGGRHRVVVPVPKTIVSTPPPVPPRSSSFGFDGRRYPGNSRNTIGGGGGGGNIGNRGSSSIWNGWGGGSGGNDYKNGGKSGGTKPTNNHSNDRGNYYKTHVSSDSRGNKVWTFSG